MPPEGSAFEGVIGDLASRFVGIEAVRFDEEFAHALRTLGEWFGTDRASFMEFSSDLATLTTAHAWVRQSDEARPPRVAQQSMPWYFEQLQRGLDVVFGSLPVELPAQAVAEREYAAHVGMRAIMTLPLAIGGRIQFVISTGDFTRLRDWTPIDVNRLRIIGEILANAFARRRRDAELMARVDEVRGLRDRLQAENASLREEVQSLHNFGEIASHSRAIRQALARASRVAPTDAVVLLLGETGTGKELFARALTLSAESSLRVEGSACVGLARTATPAASSSSLRSLDDVERDHIREVLERCGWRVNGEGNAADVLGLHPNTLRFRMKKLGIARPRPALAADRLRRG